MNNSDTNELAKKIAKELHNIQSGKSNLPEYLDNEKALENERIKAIQNQYYSGPYGNENVSD